MKLLEIFRTLVSRFSFRRPACPNLDGDEVTKDTENYAGRWALFHRVKIGDGKTVYMDRMNIVVTPWFSIKFHRIYRPDNQRELHDHPWSFASFVLRGSYEEDVPCQHLDTHPRGHLGRRVIRWFNFKRSTDRHSIRSVSRSPVWTLVFTGPRKRIWGFWVDAGKRFVPWNEYEKLNTP